jgi:hypothetical protein
MNETNRSEEFVNKFPTGKVGINVKENIIFSFSFQVPAYENDAGVYLFESNAIAHFRKSINLSFSI